MTGSLKSRDIRDPIKHAPYHCVDINLEKVSLKLFQVLVFVFSAQISSDYRRILNTQASNDSSLSTLWTITQRFKLKLSRERNLWKYYRETIISRTTLICLLWCFQEFGQKQIWDFIILQIAFLLSIDNLTRILIFISESLKQYKFYYLVGSYKYNSDNKFN